MFLASMFSLLVYVISITRAMTDKVVKSDEGSLLMQRQTIDWEFKNEKYPRYRCINHQYILTEEDRRANQDFLLLYGGILNITICGDPCSAFGEPHYNTFDQKLYSFMGTCAYVKVKTFQSSYQDFTVIEENYELVNIPGFAALNRVIVKVYGYTIELKRSPYKILINGKELFDGNTKIHFWQQGKWVAVRWSHSDMSVATDFGLHVNYNPDNYLADIIVPNRYYNQTRGLCGNNDNNDSNDFIKRNEVLTSNVHEFGASWKEEEYSAFGCHDLELDPACSAAELTVAQTMCGLFRSGGFVACNALVSPAFFERTCLFDMCANPRDFTFKCSHYKTYAEECRQYLGYAIDWRQFVPNCEFLCPANSHYDIEFDPSCENTCATPLASAICFKGDFRKIEGCLCNSGYVRQDGECIPESNCGCIDDEGKYHKIGESWIDCSGVSCKCDAKDTISCSCNGLSACSYPRFSTALCLCDGATCPRVCTLDSNGVVKHQLTTHTALANSMKHVIVESELGHKGGVNPCKINIQVRMDHFAVNFIGINFGAWPNKQFEFAFNAAFNLWNSTGVTIRGYKLATTTYTNTAPPAWTDGWASVLITRVSANVWKLTAYCVAQKMAEVNVNAPGQPLGVIDVKYPDMYHGRCYA